MTSSGSAYARFRRALTTGNLAMVRACAAELPRVDLDDALRIALLMQRRDPVNYERAAIRWLARLSLERHDVGFDDLAQGLAAFEALPSQPSSALGALVALCRRYGIRTDALAIP